MTGSVGVSFLEISRTDGTGYGVLRVTVLVGISSNERADRGDEILWTGERKVTGRGWSLTSTPVIGVDRLLSWFPSPPYRITNVHTTTPY